VCYLFMEQIIFRWCFFVIEMFQVFSFGRVRCQIVSRFGLLWFVFLCFVLTYKAWLVKHTKAYAIEEKERRFQIFKNNLRFVEEHNNGVRNNEFKLGFLCTSRKNGHNTFRVQNIHVPLYSSLFMYWLQIKFQLLFSSNLLSRLLNNIYRILGYL